MGATFTPVVSIDDARRAVAAKGAEGRRPAHCAGDLRIDGWLVQPMLNLLTRDEVQVRVRAQLMDLLLCLASRPGTVFTKDELVAEVWEGRWIAESALSRCVAELRSAIGDDARRPRVIETITKRGYRLIAAVEPATARDTGPSAVAIAPAMATARSVGGTECDNGRLSLWQWLKLSATRPRAAFGS